MATETGYDVKNEIGDFVKIIKLHSGKNSGLPFNKKDTYKITGIQITRKGVYYELENYLYFGASQLESERRVK
ncbi:MAG: hypothetical protein WCF95_07015 [bacterium]